MVFGHWNLPWGSEVAINNQYSILNTAVRPASVVNGTCGAPVYTARKPLPANAVTNAPRTTNLHWHPGHGATSYDVYLGCDANEIAAADISSYQYRGNVAGTTMDLGKLLYGTTYYWAADSVNDTNVFGRNVWQFRTAPFDPQHHV
jgi:hypothetical protein